MVSPITPGPDGSAPSGDSDPSAWGYHLKRAFCAPDTASLISLLIFLLFFFKATMIIPALSATGRPAVLLGLVLFLLWLGGRAIPRYTADGNPAPRDRDPIRIGLGLITFFLFLSLIPAHLRVMSPVESNSVIRGLIIWSSLIGISLAITEGVRHRGRLDAIFQRLTYGAAFSAAIAAVQFFTGWDPTDLIQLPGFQVVINDLGLNQNRNGFNRVVGTASHAIEFGVVMAMLLPLAIHYAFYARTSNERFWRWAIVLMLGVGVPFAVSRSALLSLIVSMGILAGGWSARRKVEVAIYGFFGVIAFGAAVPGLLGTIRGLFIRPFQGGDTSINARTQDYDIAYAFIEERPILGRGFGSFNADEFLVLDNQYLLSAIEAGIVGVLAVFSLFFLGIGLAQWIRKNSIHEETRHLARALQAAFAAGMVSAFTFDALFFFSFEGSLLILLGACGALWHVRDDEPTGAKRRSVGVPDKVPQPLWPSQEWRDLHLGDEPLTPPMLRRTRSADSV